MKKLTLFTMFVSFSLLPALATEDALAQIFGREDYHIKLIFKSEADTKPFFLDMFDFKSRSDANGDGTSDLILKHEDNNGNLKAIRVVDLASGNTLWQVEDVPQTLGISDGTDHINPASFFGFADIDADGVAEAIFTSKRDIALINPSDNSLEWRCSSNLISMGADPNCVLAGVTDQTGDGYPELIIFLPKMQQVQVWSRAQSKKLSRH